MNESFNIYENLNNKCNFEMRCIPSNMTPKFMDILFTAVLQPLFGNCILYTSYHITYKMKAMSLRTFKAFETSRKDV